MRPDMETRTTLQIVRDSVAIVRDMVLIAVIVTAVIFVGKWAADVHRIQQEIAPTAPATAPLPQDRCGGGIC